MSYPPTNTFGSGGDYNSQQNLNTDPDNFSNTGGGAGTASNDLNFSDRYSGGQQRQDFNDQGSGGGGFGSRAGHGEYAGNTTDVNTFGAGGDFGSTGQNAGMQRDSRSHDFDHGNSLDQTNAGQNFDGSRGDQYPSAGGIGGGGGGQGYDTYDDDNGTGGKASKPSFGERMKGTAETMVGKVSRNPGLVERGEARKDGFDTTNY
ncbi:hypothetical protein PHLGIDRAFT_30314 [Phlebiopsis gigantea 11061_1 CR5-6]|uniref:Uncharacterized protein n=1 Tax=Phlebiopsis gigantea (strain 11061_1 CR5-6) TaxID=745531 RepID=A0A0C3PKK7_PHLG1|nr:hypothetical protein PHLGIDRAFT_30314 [Phlebiopsis gigantea 11061_1 CR5-6]